jgi:hypothetical protein
MHKKYRQNKLYLVLMIQKKNPFPADNFMKYKRKHTLKKNSYTDDTSARSIVY